MQYYDLVLSQLQDGFDYKKAIKESPVMLKDKKSINICPQHSEHFIVTLATE